MSNNKKTLAQETKTVISDAQKDAAKGVLNGMSEEEISAVLTTVPSKLVVMDVLRRLVTAESKLEDIAQRLERDV